MKILREHIIVKVSSIFNEETSYKGVGGKTIILDTSFNPERHLRDWGIVVSVPVELYETPLMQDHVGAPAYQDDAYDPMPYKKVSDIELEIREGDKVYFHYNCLKPDMAHMQYNKYNHFHLFSKKEADGQVWHYFRVKYELVFAVIRYLPTNTAVTPLDIVDEPSLAPVTLPDESGNMITVYRMTDRFGAEQTYLKEVIMIGSYVFIEPDKETWKDISIPIPETINGVPVLNSDGTPLMKPEDQWLVAKSEPGDKYLRGWIVHIGSPLKGDRSIGHRGDYVYFQRYTNTSMQFEGKRLFRLRQRHVVGRDNSKSKSYEVV